MKRALLLALLLCGAAAQAQYADYVTDGVYRSTPPPGIGARFPDLAYRDGDGRRRSVAGLAGKVVVLHFWGSWCGPCRRELPELQRLYDGLKGRRDIVFVLLQVREPYATSKRWAETQGLRLPLHDSGAAAESDDFFRLADGTKVGDREIASRFPTTYVLDKRGNVVFTHVGPVADWSRHRAFLLETAARPARQ